MRSMFKSRAMGLGFRLGESAASASSPLQNRARSRQLGTAYFVRGSWIGYEVTEPTRFAPGRPPRLWPASSEVAARHLKSGLCLGRSTREEQPVRPDERETAP